MLVVNNANCWLKLLVTNAIVVTPILWLAWSIGCYTLLLTMPILSSQKRLLAVPRFWPMDRFTIRGARLWEGFMLRRRGCPLLKEVIQETVNISEACDPFFYKVHMNSVRKYSNFSLPGQYRFHPKLPPMNQAISMVDIKPVVRVCGDAWQVWLVGCCVHPLLVTKQTMILGRGAHPLWGWLASRARFVKHWQVIFCALILLFNGSNLREGSWINYNKCEMIDHNSESPTRNG